MKPLPLHRFRECRLRRERPPADRSYDDRDSRGKKERATEPKMALLTLALGHPPAEPTISSLGGWADVKMVTKRTDCEIYLAYDRDIQIAD